MEYNFLLRCQLPGTASDSDEILERLGVAGCHDALVGIGMPGRVALDFSREADSALDAVLGAIRDLRSAIPGARLQEAEPDLVGLTDAALLFGVSRQNLHQFMRRHPDTFPPPIHDGTMALWHLADLLRWLKAHQGYEVPLELEELADAARQVNLACASRNLDPDLSGRIRALVF